LSNSTGCNGIRMTSHDLESVALTPARIAAKREEAMQE
jgi:hypothetical protein